MLLQSFLWNSCQGQAEYGIHICLINFLQNHYSEKIEHRGKPVCRFFGTPKGCFSGDKCRFLHPDGGASSTVCSHEGSHSVSLQSSDNIPAASVHGDQESYHVSGGTVLTFPCYYLVLLP